MYFPFYPYEHPSTQAGRYFRPRAAIFLGGRQRFAFVRSVFGSIQEEVVKDAESVRNQQQQHLQQHSCTLDECFQLYTKEEQVANSS